MKYLLLVTITLLVACSNEYSQTPQPSGAWVAANPPGLAGTHAPIRLTIRRDGVHLVQDD